MANKSTGWYCRHTASIVSSTNTSVTIKVECFWQNDGWYYQINNVSAWVYCNGTAYKVKDAGSIYTSSNSQSVSCGSHEFTISKGTSSKSISCYAKITSNSSYVSGTKSSSSANVTVPAKPSYAVKYNANGGSGAPSAQTKWYGTNLTLSSTKPTRTGYSFQGWGTSSSDTSVDYAAGDTYSANAAITLYAIWKANTYTVKYNTNGGSGAPSSQTKTYGVNLTLSSTKPTRTNYNFKGWGTSSSSTTVSYAAGATYSKNAAITLYAIWELAYKKPRITSASAKRCTSDGTASNTGTYASVTFSWATDKTVSGINLYYKKSTDTSWSSATSVSASGTSGTVSAKVFGGGNISASYTYNILIRVADSGGQTDKHLTIGSAVCPIEVLSGGNGVALGKPATSSGYADIGFKTLFQDEAYLINNKALWGKTTDGTNLSLICINSNNNTVVGYGGYNSSVGSTNIYGNKIALTANETISFNSESKFPKGIVLPNETGSTAPECRLMGLYTDGTYGHIASISESNNVAIGYGSYSTKKGNTNIYGKDISFYVSNLASATSYKPYFSKGDSTGVRVTTAGFVTSSSTKVYFIIPLAKPIIGEPTVSLSSTEGFMLRQNYKYTHGSGSSTYVKPSSMSVTRYANIGVAVIAEFSNTTNAVNNSPIGITFEGTLTFS